MNDAAPEIEIPDDFSDLCPDCGQEICECHEPRELSAIERRELIGDHKLESERNP